jgi:hypothetical protein
MRRAAAFPNPRPSCIRHNPTKESRSPFFSIENRNRPGFEAPSFHIAGAEFLDMNVYRPGGLCKKWLTHKHFRRQVLPGAEGDPQAKFSSPSKLIMF